MASAATTQTLPLEQVKQGGDLALNLTFTGMLQAGSGGAIVTRQPGTTHITGTATSAAGTYNVNVTR